MKAVALSLLVLAAGVGMAQSQPTSAPAAPAAAAPSAYLNLTPKRLTFDRGRRSGAVFLLNQGDEPVTVDVALVDRVMLPDGQILAVDEAVQRPDGKAAVDGLRSARDQLQVSPRRVTLLPGRPQTVRVRLAALSEAETGERRTHLTVTTLPPREAGATAEAAAAGPGAGQLSFQIQAVYGISIPLIVRTGEPDVRAALEGLRIEQTSAPADGRAGVGPGAVLAFDLVRGGASSIYGNVEVRVAGAPKDAEPLGLARGVGVYPEVARRSVRILLSRAPSPAEKLQVTFTDDDTSPGKVLAKAEF